MSRPAASAVQIPDLADRLYHAMNRAIVDRLAAAGFPEIRVPHAAVFETIGTGSRVVAMAERAGITKQSMGELVAHLERHGYVARERDPVDGRAYVVRVTQRGRDAVDVAQGVLDEMCSRWAEVVPPARIAAAAATLTRLVADVEAFASEQPGAGQP